MSLKRCFIKVTNLLTIETQRQFNFKKKWKHSFDFDNSRKIVKSFKSRHWNKKSNSTNKTQKKKIKNDRNKIIATKTEFKKNGLSEARESENHKVKFRKLRLLEKSSRNNDFKRLIISGKATCDKTTCDKTMCDWAHVILLSFSQSNMLNLSYYKRRRYEMKLMKNEWRFARYINVLKQ